MNGAAGEGADGGPVVTILCMGTPDGSSELRCTSCGMSWQAGGLEWNARPDLGVSLHISEHHFRYAVKYVAWADKDQYFPEVN